MYFETTFALPLEVQENCAERPDWYSGVLASVSAIWQAPVLVLLALLVLRIASPSQWIDLSLLYITAKYYEMHY